MPDGTQCCCRIPKGRESNLFDFVIIMAVTEQSGGFTKLYDIFVKTLKEIR